MVETFLAKETPMTARTPLLLALGLALGLAGPASGLVIGMNPDPLTTPNVAGTQTQVDFLGATVGLLPAGGTLLDGAIGLGDDVIQLRFTNVGTTVLNLVAIGPVPFEAFDITAVGVLTGGFGASGGQVSSPDFASVVLTSMPVGQFVDVFFALTPVADGALASLGGYGPIIVSQAETALQVPEPGAALLLALSAAALLGRLPRRRRAP